MSVSVLITRPAAAVVFMEIPDAVAFGLAVNHAKVAVPSASIATRSIATEEINNLLLDFAFIEKFLLE